GAANLKASFANGQTILSDNLPSGLTYGAPTTTNPMGLTGTVSCAIASSNLICTANGAVELARGGSFDVQFTARAASAGTYTNPRAGGLCGVDLNVNVPEANEINNSCNSSSVQVIADIDLDGVANGRDACANTAPNAAVNNDGCSEAQLGLT